MNPKRYPFLIAFLLACVLAHAQVPQTLSYQGLLTDATGNPLNGTQSVTFNFYTVATGGTLAFSRGPLEVAAFQGLFTVILGNGQGNNNAGLPSLGSTQYYIGIRVGTATTDLSPRVQLTAVPYAFTASNLDPNATVSATQLTGTVPAERIAPSSIDDSKLVGISASKITGNLPATQVAGALTSATIPAANITGTVGFSSALNTNADGAYKNLVLPSANPPLLTPLAYNFSFVSSPSMNNGSGIFTAPTDGWYSFTAGVSWLGTYPATTCGAYFTKYSGGNPAADWLLLADQSNYIGANSNQYGVMRLSGSCIAYLNSGEGMGIRVYQTSGGPLKYVQDPAQIFFQGVRIGN